MLVPDGPSQEGETAGSESPDGSRSQRRAWEREYGQVRAYTTSYRHDLDRGIRLLRAYLAEQGRRIEEPVVEYGCGIGRNLLPLAVGGLEVTGLDHARTALDEFRSRARESGVDDRVRLRRHDLTEPLPLDDASVRTSLDVTAIDNLVDPEVRRRYGGEVARILDAGGTHLVVTFSWRDGYYRRWLPRGRTAAEASVTAVGAEDRRAEGVAPGRLVVEDPNTGIRNQLFTGELLEECFPPSLQRRAAATLVFRDEAAREPWTRVFLFRIYRKAG